MLTSYGAVFIKGPALVKAELTEYWSFDQVTDYAEVRLK